MTEFDKARISELEAENAKLIDSSERTMRDRERMSVSIDALSKQLAAVTKERDELLSVLRTAYDDCVQHDDDSAGTRALVQFTLAQYPELPNPGGVHGPKCTGPFAPDCRCK